MPRAAARAMELLTTPPSTLSNRPYVCTDEQPRLGEQVVHGGDALTKLSDMATGRVCSVQLVLKASNSRLRYPWKSPGRFGVLR